MARSLSVGLFLIGLALTFTDSRAVSLQFDHTLQNEGEQAAVLTWARQSLARLPPSLHERFPDELRVRFRSFGNDGAPLAEPRCAGQASNGGVADMPAYETYGRFNAVTGVISINASLLPEVVLGPTRTRRFDCYHGDYYRLATATLLHEIAHAYDALDLDESVGKSAQRSHASRSTVSTDPVWAVIAGFNSRFLGLYTGRNRDLDRLPSPQAAANAAESFAVHFEYFLLDPEYRCRFPSHHEYLENYFSWTPPAGDCHRSYEIVAGQGTRSIDLDPDRIYQLRYLLASPGQKAQSKFGHSMLHIVLCAPGTPRGPECLAQKEEHLVLGFVAFTDDSPLRAFNGVIGAYDSMLVLTSLQDQLRKYNDSQSRDITSYALDLNRAQIRRLVLRALEMYWTYRGPYRFLTNNCATELEDLVKAGILDESYINGRGRTPRGVLKRLIEAGIVDDEENLVYESGFDAIRLAAASLYHAQDMRGRRSLNRWINVLSYDQRRHTLDELEAELALLQQNLRKDSDRDSIEATMARLSELGTRVESFRLLESSVALRQEASLDRLRQREHTRLARGDDGRTALLKRLRNLAQSLLYGDRDGSGAYGIPLSGESRIDLAGLGREFDAAYRQVSTWDIGNKLAEQRKNLDRTRTLAARRYETLTAYADFARDLRIELIRQAITAHPARTNSEIRAMLEEQFGAGSFESTRVSDARYDRIRQAGARPVTGRAEREVGRARTIRTRRAGGAEAVGSGFRSAYNAR